MKITLFKKSKIVFYLSVLMSFMIANNAAAQYGPAPVFDKAPPAFWVTSNAVKHDDFAVLHFRKTFELSARPTSFNIHLSADNRYRFAVNGQHIASGPQRSDLMHWRYESLDIAPYLIQGKNIITATVWNWGALKPVAQFSHRTAFILQGHSAFEANLVNSNSQWKVWNNIGISGIEVTSEEAGGYYAAQPGEKIQGEHYPWGWQETTFDDTDWPTAFAGDRRNYAVFMPRSNAPTGRGSGWQLIASDLPQMEESESRFAEVRRSDGIAADNNFINGSGDLLIPANTQASILIDNKVLTNAYIALNTNGGKGSKIKLTYAEALKDKDGIKGHRDQIDGKTISGVYDEIYPEGGYNRNYQTLWFRTYRYVQVDIDTGDQALTLNDLHGIYTAYPFELKASFDSNLDWISSMWDMNWRVARLCAWETYFDTPYYEQLQYVGDTRIQALLTLYMTEDDKLVRQAISHFDMSRIHEGITASRYPSEQGQYIPTFSLIWVAMVHDYWMHREDDDYIKQMLSGTRGVIQWFENKIDDTGLVGAIDWWPFVDWANDWILGRPPGAKDGHSVMISLQFVYALQRAAELELAVGQPTQAEHYRRLSEQIIKAARKHAWDSNKGFFRDSLESDDMSQQTNIMAALIGAIGPEQQKNFVSKVIADKSITQSTYYYSFYVLEALKQAGLANEYLDQLGPWKNMLALGLTTTPETPEPTRSDSHAWSAHPNYGLLATVLGIRPSSPGFKTVEIKPALGKLTHAKGVMPHPYGQITVDITDASEQHIKGIVTLPEGLSGNLIWQGKNVKLEPGKQVIDL
jgi:alpha-L-rhamnosidase